MSRLHATKTHRFFAYGYFGFGNFGDELILRAFLRALGERRPGSAVVAASNGSDCPAHLYPGVELTLRPRSRNPFTISNLASILSSDAVTFPGGGVFQDYGLASFAHYYAVALAAFAAGRGPHMLYQGFTGIRRETAKTALVWLIRYFAGFVSVRDGRSLDLAARSGRSGIPKVFADASFLLADDAARAALCANGSAAMAGGGKKTAGFSFRPWPGIEAQALASWAAAIARATGTSPRLYSMQRGADCELNASVARILSSEHGIEAAVEEYTEDPAKLAGMLSSNAINAGMRFHFCVMSVMSGVPAIGVAYDGKVAELFGEMNLAEYCIPAARAAGPGAGKDAAVIAAAALRNSFAIRERYKRYCDDKSASAWALFDAFLEAVE